MELAKPMNERMNEAQKIEGLEKNKKSESEKKTKLPEPKCFALTARQISNHAKFDLFFCVETF